jgi:hypothetical protein
MTRGHRLGELRPRPRAPALRPDFADKTLGKVVPYGVYDIAANAGFVSLGITSDTAEFAVAAIRCWLERMGSSGTWPTRPSAC